jgi:flagellar motility protein MotE (MotC chaperone)
LRSLDDGELPFSLATPHHADTWEQHDPHALAAKQSCLDRSIDELALANDDQQQALRSELERKREEISERLKQLEADAF